MVWIALWPHLAAVSLALASMGLFALRRSRFQVSEHINPTVNKLIPRFWAEWGFWCVGVGVGALERLGLSPNQVTILSGLVGLGSGVCYAVGWVGAAGWLLILSGFLDMMDGWLARRLEKTSRSGDFLDAVLDRYVEIFLYLGIAVFYRRTFWMVLACALALAGSMMVSYTRARGEVMGVVYNRGFFQRAERLVYLTIVSIFSPLLELIWNPTLADPFYWPVAGVVLLTALGANVGGLQRVAGIVRLMDAPEGGDPGRPT
jgi:phosphatidylglycerophosphate synthase